MSFGTVHIEKIKTSSRSVFHLAFTMLASICPRLTFDKYKDKIIPYYEYQVKHTVNNAYCLDYLFQDLIIRCNLSISRLLETPEYFA